MDLILSFGSIILSVIVWFVSFGYDDYMYDKVGGGALPRILAVIITICSILVIIQYFLGKKKGNVKTKQKGNLRSALLLAVSVLIYILILTHVGYVISTVALVVALLLIQGVRDKKTIAISTVSICGFLYVVFVLVLRVKMPKLFFLF